MPSFNQITIVGNVGQDPDLRFSPSGVGILKFSVGVSEGRKKPDGTWENETTWFPVTIMGERAEKESTKHKKGDPILVSGKMKSRSWQDGEGNKKTAWDLIAFQVTNLKPRPKQGMDGWDQGQWEDARKPVKQAAPDQDELPWE